MPPYTETAVSKRNKTDEDKVCKIYSDLKYSDSKFSKLHDEIKTDFEYVQGKQWDDVDIQTLREQGVKALTINKLKPIIKLVTGIERQSKSDFVALPEGSEDQVKGDIASRLMKNVVKQSGLEQKESEQFKNGAIGGMAFLEPYLDYQDDLINGELKFRKINACHIFPDPNFKEYDMSDGRFLIKITTGLSKDDLITLFPDKESVINNIADGALDLDAIRSVSTSTFSFDYPKTGNDTLEEDNPEDEYDLIDYYYKKLIDKYYVADQQRGIFKQTENKEEAEKIATQIPTVKIIKRKSTAIYLTQTCGKEILYDDVAPTYPSWNKYPIIPFFAELITEEIDKKELCIQGVVRVIRDLQMEFNKRRTQELRHLNSSANSGFDIEDNQLDPQNLEKLKKVGSSPGVVITRKAGTPPLVRLTPMPLSQGHAQLAEENAQDLKEASGVNPDLLANDSQSQSGRAILLKQRQGMVMIQEMLDNYSYTKKILGKFILTQLKEVYTVETAIRVLGDDFISESFSIPVTAVLDRGVQKIQQGEHPSDFEQQILLQYPQNSPEQPAIDPMGQPLMTVDIDAARQMVNEVLTDSNIGKYDVSIGEGPFAETVRMANFMEISELAKQGIPIPPDVLIQLSQIPDIEKKDILQRLQQQALLAQQQGQSSPDQSQGQQ